MPGKIKVKVLAGRNLPVMDRAGDTTDAFVEIKFGGVTHKTDVCRKSLNPHWNSTEWYRFEVDESELQDEPLQLRLMDHDTYSANDAIGKVVISLAPLLARDTAHTNKTPAAATPSGAVMSGWIPVLDTMHGIRGELNVIVKVELFSDFNKYKTSSCGVQFFHCPMIPPGYRASAIHGFVEELVVNDDPEYQWIDKIRTPRASNEARQVAFIKLGNQVQRLVGLKAAELGANAVVGYQQDFDLEGEAGVVARAIGTAVSITPLPTPSIPTNIPPCSQQQLKQYLDILSTDNENIPDLNQYFSTHQDELQKLVSILHPKYSSNFLDEGENPDDEEPSNSLMRQSSIKSYTDSVSIYQDEYASHKSFQTITEDQTDLNKLLNRIEKDNSDADSDSSGPMQTIKKIKSNFFVKKLGSLRRKSDKSEKSNKTSERDDAVSIKSNSSDTSKISLSDLKNEFKKRLKKPKFRKPQFKNLSDQGVGMASILARSVIHAHTSLACIAETQDSETSPASTLRRTSESEPTINMTDEEIQKLQPKIVPEIFEEDDYESGPPVDRCVSLKDLNLEQDKNVLPVERPRKTSESCPSTPVAARQENLLSLPGNESYFGSASSVVSGESSEMYSSSEGSEDSSDLKTDTDRSIETTSSVVHTVLAHDVNPALVEQMERKLSIISGTTPESEPTPTDQNREPSNAPGVENNKNELRETEKASTSTDAKPEPFVIERPNNHHFKFHNPFTHKSKSISAPSSPVEKREGFVYRSSRRIRRQWSKISSNTIKSLSHYSLISKKKHADSKSTMSQPGSSSDVPSKAPSETVLGSPFLSYTDLMSLDKEGPEPSKAFHRSDEIQYNRVQMYIGSEPASRASISVPSSPYHGKDDYSISEQSHRSQKREKSAVKPIGLVHTAMETILMDKVQALLISTSPKPNRQRKFFDDVNEKLEKVEVARKSIDELKPEQKNDLNQNKIQPVDGSDKKAVQCKTWSQDPSDSNLETLNIVQKDEPRTLSKDPSVSNLEATEPIDPEILSENTVTKSGESDPKNGKKLTRQDSVHSTTESERKMSNESESNIVIPCKSLTQCGPMLQHFHPIMSGSHAPLETIPSLPESSSFAQSLDLDDDLDINCVSVCDNTHAACSDIVGRSERDRDREKERDRGSPRHTRHESCGKEMTAVAASALNSSLNSTSTPVGMHRRSSDSDLSITPKAGSSLNASGNTGSGGGAILRPSMNSNNLELLEYPFLTMSHYPHGFIVNIGGCVCARSVKLVDGGSALAMRAAWWAELRTEVRAHARALRCNALLAYKETANICEDVCVLSASGTAAVINLDCDLNTEIDANIAGQNGSKTAVDDFESLESCGVAHIPYSPAAAPSSERYHCGHCRRARVPSVLLATCAKPNRLTSHSKAITLTAVAARARRAPPQSEPGARDISDQLPFLEYELHKLLLAKLRMQGANAIFNLQTQIAIGERCVMALASGTAVRLAALPPPTPPRIKASEKDKDALDIQRALWDAFTANKAANGYDIIPDVSLAPLSLSDAEEPPTLELCADKDAALLELDEAEDVETARSLAVRRQHMPVFCYGMKPKAAAPPQAFVQVIRARFPLSSVGGATVAAERHVARALDVVTYKLRRLSPAALIEPAFQLELPEDEIQLVLSGAALQLQDPNKPEPATNGTHDASNNNGTPADGPLVHSQASGDGDDEIFALDEEQAPRQEKVTESFEEKNVVLNGQVPTTVSLTSQAVIPGARIVRRICLLRLLFVRETTTVRELGGLSGFLHALTSEVMAIVRAYTAALGGNALTSFYITQLMLQDNAHKNQGQCLMSVGGDVVHITY
ncbi:unnamed protein product [Plutella xylostella]|uniref:(diamondback moth) hypothetical protein n=1 Tax=Plutella xylostella TaxID=51655 RepID=A0A8S4G012_PLUXY|nr:unnamed protein product [Plutella xylostella]